MAAAREKRPDEMFCGSCGAVISKQAEICPECGVRTDHGDTSDDAVSEIEHTHISNGAYWLILLGLPAWAVFYTITSILTSAWWSLLLWVLVFNVGLAIAMAPDVYFFGKEADDMNHLIVWPLSVVLLSPLAAFIYIYYRERELFPREGELLPRAAQFSLGLFFACLSFAFLPILFAPIGFVFGLSLLRFNHGTERGIYTAVLSIVGGIVGFILGVLGWLAMLAS